MAAIGDGWEDGAWVEVSWVDGAWAKVVGAVRRIMLPLMGVG